MSSRPLTRLGLDRARHLPQRTIRLRLTGLYGALFLVSGALLLAITYLLFGNATGDVLYHDSKSGKQPSTGASYLFHRTTNKLPRAAAERLAQTIHRHATELHQLLIQSGIALAIMTVISVALGWLVAGRVLAPLRVMTATTRRISEDNLHQRLAIDGPRDELRDLADTVDGLLERLEGAFCAQRRFVANAAHELRTPMTLLRALLEETLTDSSATIDSFRATSNRLLALGEEQECLLESLLTLASSERGLDRKEPFDLSVIADTVLLTRPAVDDPGVQIHTSLAPAPTTGDPALAERLAANLIDNAVRYNTPGGYVQIRTTTAVDGRAELVVSNTGAEIPPTDVERLFEPFQHLNAVRTNGHGGYGLGLSIVQAIATAHHAQLTAQPRPNGGLEIQVSFPLSTTATPHLPTSHPTSQNVRPSAYQDMPLPEA